MASELKRGAIRVLSNYSRLFLLLVMGIAFVPIFISGIGAEAYGLYGLLGSTMGIAEMCKAIVRSSEKTSDLAPAQRETPVFLAHGVFDDVVPIEGSRQAALALREAGLPVELREYPMGHQIVQPELVDLRRFLIRVLDLER
jgi:acetyl esterase/lipase